jgi:predicted transcriptional regulator
MSEKYQLTPVELELMEILWKLGEGTVHDVINELPKNRNLAYTSVSTILRILEQKKILVTKKVSRQHIYRPLLSKSTFATHSVKKIVKQVFSGNSVELVSNLVGKNNLTIEEIDAIQDLLTAKKQELIK